MSQAPDRSICQTTLSADIFRGPGARDSCTRIPEVLVLAAAVGKCVSQISGIWKLPPVAGVTAEAEDDISPKTQIESVFSRDCLERAEKDFIC